MCYIVNARYSDYYNEWTYRHWFMFGRLQIVFAALRRPEKALGHKRGRNNNELQHLDFRSKPESQFSPTEVQKGSLGGHCRTKSPSRRAG